MSDLTRLGQLSALDDGTLDDGRMRTVLRVDLRPVTAAGDPPSGDLPDGEVPWSGVIMLTDTWTGEGRADGGRMFLSAGGGHRALPLPFLVQTGTSGMGGHDGAEVAGRVDSITLGSPEVTASGVFADTDKGREAARLYQSGYLSGVSVDLTISDERYDYIEGDDGEIESVDFVAVAWEIAALTGTPVPAFADARITVGALVAGAQHHPPAEWFTDPHLDALTPFTVDGDRVYGHLAPWQDRDGRKACHIGYPDVCVCAPHSESGYGQFLVGEIDTDGGRVPVGAVTLRGGHAPLDSSLADAAAHYDDTDAAAAYVTCGEDDHGIWVAGCVRPGLSDDDRFVLAASTLSGDWREWPARSGTLELLRVCSVNTPGFAVLRSSAHPGVPVTSARVTDGRLVAVAASGAGLMARLKAAADPFPPEDPPEDAPKDTPPKDAPEDDTADRLDTIEERLDTVEERLDGIDGGMRDASAVTAELAGDVRARVLGRLN